MTATDGAIATTSQNRAAPVPQPGPAPFAPDDPRDSAGSDEAPELLLDDVIEEGGAIIGLEGTGRSDAVPADFPDDVWLAPYGESAAGDPVHSDAETPVARGAAPLQTDPAAVDPAAELASRLDRLADRLRSEGAAALAQGIGGSDRLDTLLSGLLAGYLAGRDG